MSRGIINFLFIAVAVVVFLVWTRPQLEEVAELRTEKAAINEALSNSKELQGIRDNLLSQSNSIPGADLIRLSRILPDSPEETKLMVEISNIAQSNGVVLESFQTKKASAVDIGSIDMDVSFTSSYEALISFVETMEKSLRLVDINEISFSAGDENSYKVNLKAKSYFKK